MLSDPQLHYLDNAATSRVDPAVAQAITTAMVSALTDTPVKPGLAMTGEGTLRGRVLAIGGLREKTMAALRNGIKTVIVPAENEKDLEEIDQTVRAALHFILVEQVDQVLAAALSLSGTACERDTEQGGPFPAGKGRTSIGLKQ